MSNIHKKTDTIRQKNTITLFKGYYSVILLLFSYFVIKRRYLLVVITRTLYSDLGL